MSERLTDLEHFPESEAGRRMLSYVTANWYDKSYVGKWIFEILGREIDASVALIKDFPNQLFVDTATWALIYHEQKYGLTMQPLNMDYAARRKRIHEKMDTKAPMSPYRMERLIQTATGYEAHVYDIYDPGHSLPHPNVFGVRIAGEEPLDFKYALRKIRSFKQSHTRFIFSVLMMAIELMEAVQPQITFRMEMPWWGIRILDGQYVLNGEIALDQLYPMTFYDIHRFQLRQVETIGLEAIGHRMIIPGNEFIHAAVTYRTVFSWWTLGLLNGRYELDGMLGLDQRYPMDVSVRYRDTILEHESIIIHGKYLFDVINEGTLSADAIRFHMASTGYSEPMLDGSFLLNGDHELDSIIYPTFDGLTIITPIETKEDFGMYLYIPSKAVNLNGSVNLDGEYFLNSGREEL